jgi:transposase
MVDSSDFRGELMRDRETIQDSLFSRSPEEVRIPREHPLREIRRIADKAHAELNGRFEQQFSQFGRPSTAPEFLLRAMLLQIFHSIRSEKLLMELLTCNYMFRWFVGLSADQDMGSPAKIAQDREGLLQGAAVHEYIDRVVDAAAQAGLLSDGNFSVDGAFIKSLAARKSFSTASHTWS